MSPAAADAIFDWAGVPFTAVSHHDGRFFRVPGLYGFVRRVTRTERILLFIGHADDIAAAAGPSHPLWVDALRLGMNELHLSLKARERLDRLQLRHHLVRRESPILNVTDGDAPAAAFAWSRRAG